MEEDRQNPHKRRVRYSGTHPTRFSEKYKEHDPEKYRDVVEKVIRKGSTPAGMHLPICVEEILAILRIRPGQRGLDATLGYGGHSRRMLESLAGKGHLCALDVDAVEIAKTEARLRSLGYGPDILTVVRRNFADIDRTAEEFGPFDFLLADLGVSSMQLDNPERGFSYKKEGPLDLRLNPLGGTPASQRLRELDRWELEGMLRENSDEPYAGAIAQTIASKLKKGQAIDTTTQLADAVAKALAALPQEERQEAVKKSCARVFQALRIDVNGEFEALDAFLQKLPEAMTVGGRIAILTFHSGEDRMVKKSFKELEKAGIYREAAKEPIRPCAEECARNARARSAKLRWAVKA
ncbi:MAG: 16S rRNA (cytosine(1402)-N(4))-methyltransferase RsmH [Lachnospiraceae bacterium]|nr:16S rRNA (cytosine(1402)-N(4))-methyltransferase RsmH [Lachnospiraceae bacterium]